MAVKIRLQRGGRKRRPFYQIVVADSRAPRDGRYIEKIGDYNPNTNPATINLNLDTAVEWLQKGAQPTDTMRAILSYKGAMYKNHLLVGVNKGAITEEQMNEKFNAWMEDKAARVSSKEAGLADAKLKAKADAMAAEVKRKEAIAEKVLAKNSELTEAVDADAAESVEGEEVVDSVEETTGEEGATEEVVAEAEAPATEEVAEEPAAEEETKEG